MPRKKIEISHEFPYHITARTNNKDWFHIPISDVWLIFSFCLKKAVDKFNLNIHAFVLMNNHYHLIATTSDKYELPKVMEWFQRSVSRQVNYRAKRINHLFGGPYSASVIKTEAYYYHALRYLYRNPIEAGLTNSIQSYKYSSLKKCNFKVSRPSSGIDMLVNYELEAFFDFINNDYSEEVQEFISWRISKKEFVFPKRISQSLKKKLSVEIDT